MDLIAQGNKTKRDIEVMILGEPNNAPADRTTREALKQ